MSLNHLSYVPQGVATEFGYCSRLSLINTNFVRAFNIVIIGFFKGCFLVLGSVYGE